VPDAPAVAPVFGAVVAWFIVLIVRQRGWHRAERRAALLVRQVLAPGEIDGREERGYLEVRSRTVPGRTCRAPVWPGRITVLEGGRPTTCLCWRPTQSLPSREPIVVHKLMRGASSCTGAPRTGPLP